jgi:hypothetical protein
MRLVAKMDMRHSVSWTAGPCLEPVVKRAQETLKKFLKRATINVSGDASH